MGARSSKRYCRRSSDKRNPRMAKKVTDYAEDIGSIKATLESLDKRINGSMDAVKKHIEQGDGWRKTIIGIICLGIIQVATFSYTWGVLNTKVSSHIEEERNWSYKTGVYDEKIGWIEQQLLDKEIGYGKRKSKGN